MAQYIKKSDLVAEIKRLMKHSEMVADHNTQITELVSRELDTLYHLISFLDTLEVKEVDLIIHTIIAECCDWLAKNTNLSHDKIEGCRNLMLTVKEEQFKTQKGK
jgi:hypothetical protein